MKALLRGSLATFVGSVALFSASTAFAEGEPCINDTDCPGAECGGEVCNWNKPQGDKFTCNPAGTVAPVGGMPKDGWCTTVDNCKCKAQGATCAAPYCTITKPPAGSAGTSAGGSASTAGTSSTTAGTATTPTAGTASGGSGTKPAASDDGGGCSVGVPGGSNTGLALGVGLVGLGLALARRRR
jgi:MYXO-CTERM domain-containing protein